MARQDEEKAVEGWKRDEGIPLAGGVLVIPKRNLSDCYLFNYYLLCI